MQDRMYLLSIAEFLGESGEELMRRAQMLVDETRRQRVIAIRQPKAKAAGLGAGLLLQLAVQEGMCGLGQNHLISVTPGQLLSKLSAPLSLKFTYGKSGKPYLKDYPFYFNLSHSGEYVVCVISEAEIGVDIQEHRPGETQRLSERFFSTGERQALENCSDEERTKLFYDFWAKKEAYGKFTGGGIVEGLKMDCAKFHPGGAINLPGEEDSGRVKKVQFEVLDILPDYSIALCREF